MMIGPLPSPCFLPFLSEPAKFPCLSGRALCPRLSCPLPPREAAGAIQNRRGLVLLAGPAAVQPAVCVASGLCTFGAAQRFAPAPPVGRQLIPPMLMGHCCAASSAVNSKHKPGAAGE